MLTVLLPTASRPAMLREALQSVVEQTAVSHISRIFVSENGGERSSRDVCGEFPRLPITYIFRNPPLSSLGHAQILMKECLEGELTCILHDDDWWLPNHVQDAVFALADQPDASVYGANLILCREGVFLKEHNCSLMPWVAANYPPPAALWRIVHTNVLLASLLNFLVHYSSMVVRTAALRQSAYVYDLGNPYDNDRMILFALSRLGPVLFSPKPSVVVRTHADRETMRFGMEERNRRMCETTRWMVGSGVKSWSTIAAAFARRLAACPDEKIKIQLLREATLKPWCLPEIAIHLDRATDREFFAMYDRARETFAGEKPQGDR